MTHLRMKAAVAWIGLLGGLAAGPCQASDGVRLLPPVTSLQADATLSAQTRRPIVILFSLPGCRFCNEVRQNYLLPLLNESTPQEQPILREIVLNGMQPITGFKGEVTSEHLVAKNYGVRVAPSVLMVDAAGKLLVPPVVGGDTSGLYGGYLANALSEAARLLKAMKPISRFELGLALSSISRP